MATQAVATPLYSNASFKTRSFSETVSMALPHGTGELMQTPVAIGPSKCLRKLCEE